MVSRFQMIIKEKKIIEKERATLLKGLMFTIFKTNKLHRVSYLDNQ